MKIKLKFVILLLLLFSAIGLVYPENESNNPSSVCVSGIMYDPNSPLAVVNGESVRQGEQINGITVKKISDSMVSFECKGQTFERVIGEGCLTPQLIYKKTSQIAKVMTSHSATRIPGKNTRSPIPPAFRYEAFSVIVFLVLFIVFYIYNSLCLHKIANKTDTPFGWFAWLPILNVFLILMIANKSFWWIILLLIPLVNLVCIIILWMEIAKARNKPAWLGLLMMLPVANFLILGYLAFSE